MTLDIEEWTEQHLCLNRGSSGLKWMPLSKNVYRGPVVAVLTEG